MSQKKYWNGLEDLHQSPEFQKMQENEFQEELPMDLSENLLQAQTPRRDFLKFLGFSTVAATVAASCEMKVRKAIPYAIKPDAELATPSVPNYYASTYVDNGETCSVVVKTKDGRPVMVEGNKLCNIFQGGVTARVVASTISLYDTARLRGPQIGKKAVDTFEDIDNQIKTELATANNIALVTGTINSPSSQEVINQFISKYPKVSHIQYDAVSYSGILDANEASLGSRMIPSYHFENAKVIFGLGCDFLGTWLSPAEFKVGYGKTRKIVGSNTDMSKHYQVESILSLTGSNADERATCKPSEYGKVAVALLNAISSGAAPSFPSKKLNTLITNAAKDLKNNAGLVVCGSNDKNVQLVVNAINSAIGAYGKTISTSVSSNYKKGRDIDMAQLLTNMEAGQVDGIIFYGVNPVYDFNENAKFATALKKVKTSISLNDRNDETTALCKYKVPANHWLESWGDAEPKTGYISFQQPTISPLFKTRQYQDSLLVWAGISGTYADFHQAYWSAKLGSRANYDKALQDGIVQPQTVTIGGSSASGASAEALNEVVATTGGEYEILIYESVAMGAGGVHSNNPWLQELPDPISKVTWDNYAMMSPTTAKKFNAELTGINQVVTDKRVVKITMGNKTLELPVVVVPGVHDSVIGVAMGYGRKEHVGLAANDTGKNVFNFVTNNGANRLYSGPISLATTSNTYKVAITQTHLSSENRPIIKEYSIDEFKKDPLQLIKERKKELKHYVTKPWEHHDDAHDELKSAADFDAKGFELAFAKEGTMYPHHEKPGIHWGMSIDLSTCNGCAACVVACYAENNVSVVGKREVLKTHDMSWLRIDRYFAGDPKDPDSIQVIYQPMLCQHCDNAPCENVCPVSATNHSQEGLNQMAYNRCIGTKYCANNCPYKVRRFNWYDYNGGDSFSGNLYEDGRRDMVNDDLTRMVLNPDVSVRSRGVMEKCTFCVQRLQDGKLKAKKEGVPVQDQHISTACQTACSSDSIKFGNINDISSEVYKDRYVNNKERLFYVLEYLHILPNVSYLAKIKNTNTIVNGSAQDEIYNQHI